jgi:hypothetical protein
MIRFRPRFSVRTLAIFVTLVCAYFGVWEATKRWAIDEDFESYLEPDGTLQDVYTDPFCPMPFIFSKDIRIYDSEGLLDIRRPYYLWLFGPTVRLPVEGDWPTNWPIAFRYSDEPGAVWPKFYGR